MPSKMTQSSNNYPNVPFSAIMPGKSQQIAFSGTSARATNQVTKGVSIVRLTSPVACFVKMSQSGSDACTTADVYLPANVVTYLGCNDGDYIYALQVSAILGSGTLYITEGAT